MDSDNEKDYGIGRIRKTISFKPKVLKKIDKVRGNKSRSKQINEDYEEKFKIKKKNVKKTVTPSQGLKEGVSNKQT